jgi:hypothetical protein
MFVEVAAGAGAHLITGNRRHFPPDQCAGIVVVSPAEFIESWRAQQAEKHSP